MDAPDRFARQRALAGFSDDGQARLGAATVLVVGVGALGCPAADLLVRAGVGRLRLVDHDAVGLDNLHRQTLYAEADVGRPKVDAAAERLRAAAGAGVTVEALHRTFQEGDLDGVDAVLDCTDDSGTRDWLHALCVARGVPLAWGAVEGWEGQWATVVPGGPCLRCLWPAPGDAPSCADVGVLGAVSATVGAQQALAAVRALLGQESGGTLWLHDGRAGTFDAVRFPRRPECAVCADATVPGSGAR